MNPFPNESPGYRAAREELLTAAIHHWWSSELFGAARDPGEDPRHVDYMWPIWNVLDVTPDGRGTGWGPSLAY